MAIKGMRPLTISTFTGKNTTQNLSKASIGTLIAASNSLILSDNNVRRAPGYTEVIDATKLALCPGSGPATAQFDFQRSVDSAQFLIVQRGTALFACQIDGTFIRTLAVLTNATPCMFVASAIICYLSNGTDALRLVDKGGTLTAYNWGIQKVAYTPTIALSPGTLTLTYGRRYVVSDVSKYTDSLGIERISVSAPSEYSAHTGPIADQVVTVGGMIPSTDPQVNYKWIFATADSPLDTSSSFYFAAEVTTGTTAWADDLLDTDLDSTRQAPFDNFPAPPSMILTTFQSRQIAIQKNQIRLSGGAEILVGIPDEAFPLSLFFNVPSGALTANDAVVLNDGNLLAVSNGDTWFGYTGYDSTTFTEKDRIATPGSAGRWAHTQVSSSSLAYTSPSKRVWVWTYPNDPVEMSANIANQLYGTVAMESIDDANLPNARMHWYSYEKMHLAVLATRTKVATSPGLDWMALFGVPQVGVTPTPNSLMQTDKFPTDLWQSSADVKVGERPYIYFGLADGRIARWPDGFQDAGVGYPSAFSHAWICPIEGRSRFFWVDMVIDVSDIAASDLMGGPANYMSLSAQVLEAAEDTPLGITVTPVKLVTVPVPTSASSYALRGSLQLQGIATGRYLRLNVALVPQNKAQAVTFDVCVQKLVLQFSEVYGGA